MIHWQWQHSEVKCNSLAFYKWHDNFLLFYLQHFWWYQTFVIVLECFPFDCLGFGERYCYCHYLRPTGCQVRGLWRSPWYSSWCDLVPHQLKFIIYSLVLLCNINNVWCSESPVIVSMVMGIMVVTIQAIASKQTKKWWSWPSGITSRFWKVGILFSRWKGSLVVVMVMMVVMMVSVMMVVMVTIPYMTSSVSMTIMTISSISVMPSMESKQAACCYSKEWQDNLKIEIELKECNPKWPYYDWNLHASTWKSVWRLQVRNVDHSFIVNINNKWHLRHIDKEMSHLLVWVFGFPITITSVQNNKEYLWWQWPSRTQRSWWSSMIRHSEMVDGCHDNWP